MNTRILRFIFGGIAVAATAAAFASATTLAGLARGAGWVAWTPWLLPATLDVGSACAGLCWLSPGAPDRARSFAKRLTIAGIAAGLAGNAAGHLIESGSIESGPYLIVVVGGVPALMLGVLAHLAALLVEPSPAVESTTDPIGSTTDQPAQPAPAPNPDPAERLDSSAGSDTKPDPILTVPAADRSGDGSGDGSGGPDPVTPPRASARSGRSGRKPDRTDDELRIELARLIDCGELPTAPAAEPIRTALGIAPKTARMLRDELRSIPPAMDGDNETEAARG